jgi:hypothetical protein
MWKRVIALLALVAIVALFFSRQILTAQTITTCQRGLHLRWQDPVVESVAVDAERACRSV